MTKTEVETLAAEVTKAIDRKLAPLVRDLVTANARILVLEATLLAVTKTLYQQGDA